MRRTCWGREVKAWLRARVTPEKHNSFSSSMRKKVLLPCRQRKELGDISRRWRTVLPDASKMEQYQPCWHQENLRSFSCSKDFYTERIAFV